MASHPQRGTVTLPAGYVDRHVELGWAVTGYGNQGDTVDVGLAVLEPGTTRNRAYVAPTRGRAANLVWIPNPTGTLDLDDALTGMIARTPDHHSALATSLPGDRKNSSVRAVGGDALLPPRPSASSFCPSSPEGGYGERL